MPIRYSGRHRQAPGSARGRHRCVAERTPRAVIRPLSISVVSCGTALAIVQFATSTPFGDISQASALPRTAAMAMVAPTEAAAPLANPTPAASTTTTRAAATTASASGVATATATPPKTTTTTATPTVDLGKQWVLPVEGAAFTSGYGPRWGAFHHGIDLAKPTGTPLKAMSSGIVTFAGQQQGYGNIVQIRYWDGTVSYYGHMNAIAVTVGQPVLPGQVVGQLGNTGQSTGPHLHLEIHPAGGADVDPVPWLAAHGLKVG